MPAIAAFVLPTCVGMVRFPTRWRYRRFCSPHVRGDGPDFQLTTFMAALFSPRAWGWSVLVGDKARAALVLPTCVGMVRAWSSKT